MIMARSSAGGHKASTNTNLYFVLIALSFVLGGMVVFFAFGNGDSVRCDQFKDPSLASSCYTDLAIDRKDVSICSNVAGIGSVNGCYKEVAISRLDATVCARIDDNLLKDSCYNRVGYLTKDKSVCSMIKDLNLKNGCFADIEIGNQTFLPAENQTASDTSNGSGTEAKAQANQMVSGDPSQKVIISSVSTCGPDICFQIKYDVSRPVTLPISEISFFINGIEAKLSGWSGNDIGGTPCTSLSTLAPGQNCYGKILNATCLMGDLFEVTAPNGFIATSDISGCDFR